MKIILLIILFSSYENNLNIEAKPVETEDSVVKRQLRLLSDSSECKEDIRRYCGKLKGIDDLALLNCLQDSEEVMKTISDDCQHFIWSYKRNLTTSDFLNNKAIEKCGQDMSKIGECKTEKYGHRIPCLLDHKTEITNKTCYNFLNKVGVIVFSDYHLIYKFVDRCENDISKYQCGRINTNSDGKTNDDRDSNENLFSSIISQANTIECLINDVMKISKECQHEILRLSELQSDDYHLNKKLYLACREDRETLCSNIIAGEGRVYACLMKLKFDDRMSKQCKAQLIKKQQVESLDVKADYSLFTHCKADIEKYQCKQYEKDSEEVMKMSVVLLCLEDAQTNRNAKIDANCKAELTQKRLEMMEDFHISPEVVFSCRKDVERYCTNIEKQPGAVLNCLMDKVEAYQTSSGDKLESECHASLLELLKAVNPTEDIMVLSPVVRQACSSSFSALCDGVTTKEEAFQCLVQNIANPDMAPECRSSLKSLLHFISYDFRIDHAVERACHKDAMKLCGGPDNINEMNKRSETARKLEYHCMYQHYMQDRISMDIAKKRGENPVSMRSLSVACSNEIFRLIKAQASEFQLDPIVFDSCLEDFSKHCSKKMSNTSGHECLQRHFNDLQVTCKKAVIEFSKMEDADMRLNQRLNEACMPMIKLFCSNVNPEDLTECLIFHKRHNDMIPSCQAAIEHIQIMNLEEYSIDHRFAKFCEKEINDYCRKDIEKAEKGTKIISKRIIVSCLSRTVVEKLVAGESHPLSKMCRRQFSFELLQRSDSATLDHNLQEDCRNDIRKFCSAERPDKVSTCLRKKQDELETKCHARIFRRERLEAVDANFDGRLKRVCSQMIKERCKEVRGTELFQCLHRQMKDPEFDEDCRQLIYLRLERRMNDIRLNPNLLKDCKTDIEKHCKNIYGDKMEPKNGLEFEGAVITCLKEVFSNNSKDLFPTCRERILKIIIEANAHLRLDPVLRKNCYLEIHDYCKSEFLNHFDVNVGSVQDCLKHTFLTKDKHMRESCRHEVSRLLREGRADVHVDSQLFDACEDTIMKLCRTESYGEGKKMSCLLYFADDPKVSKLMNSRCLEMIKERRLMWSYAANFEPQSFQDIVLQINQSSMRTYLFSMLGLMISAFILLGICCGRLSKRVPVDMKNK